MGSKCNCCNFVAHNPKKFSRVKLPNSLQMGRTSKSLNERSKCLRVVVIGWQDIFCNWLWDKSKYSKSWLNLKILISRPWILLWESLRTLSPERKLISDRWSSDMLFPGYSYLRMELCCSVMHHSSLKGHCNHFADKEQEMQRRNSGKPDSPVSCAAL